MSLSRQAVCVQSSKKAVFPVAQSAEQAEDLAGEIDEQT